MRIFTLLLFAIASCSQVYAETMKYDWLEGARAACNGATREYYNRGADLRWTYFMGDYRDADNVLQGGNAYTKTKLIDDNGSGYIDWDVKPLVQEWVDGTYTNKGLLIRGTYGSGEYFFYSREYGVESMRPKLVVSTTKGDFNFQPVADLYLDPTTAFGSGDSTTLMISDTRRILIRFDLSPIPADATVNSAQLRLYVYEEFGHSELNASVFRCDQGDDLPTGEPRMGFAENYPLDDNIASHPAVLLYSDFENDNWGEAWTFGTDSDILDVTHTDNGNLFEPLRGSALRVTVKKGDHYGMSVGFDFMEEIGYEPEKMYFRYYMRIGDNWNPSASGKMPGFGGTYNVGGWGQTPSNGTNGWSARSYFDLPIAQGNPFSEMSQIGSYVYHVDMEETYGDHEPWKNSYLGILEKNRWYCIEQYIELNNPGQNDGILYVWVDGQLAYYKTDWRWRNTENLKIERIWMDVYHGGDETAPQDMNLYFDNIVVANSYIGPMAEKNISRNRINSALQSIFLLLDSDNSTQ